MTALGKRSITGFHHEARTLPDGNIAVLAAVEQILTDVQGPGPVDVLGDMIVVLDKNLNVVWTWDTFDYLDAPVARISGKDVPMPYAANLEKLALPSVAEVVDAAKALCYR